MLCKAFPYNCYQIMCMYIYILYTHNVFSTSTSWLLCFGCRFHDVHNVITVIKGTLDQTFGANTGWIWRTSLKQFGVWGDILQRLLPIHIYKICFQSLPGNIVASPFFYAPPPLQNRLTRLSPSSPATKPMSLTTAVPCYKPQGSHVDYLAGQSMNLEINGN